MNQYFEEEDVANMLNATRKKCIGICLIIVIIATLINLSIFTIFKNNLAESISKNMSDEVKTQVTEQLSDEVLDQYKREFNLPDDYTTIGTYVYSKSASSVVEIYCQSSGTTSTATGIILNNEGYILTNAHVVTYEQSYRVGFKIETTTEAHKLISIRLANENDWRACTVVNYDINKDLAIIKLSTVPTNLKPATFADSDRLMLGEGAVIIGNAYGLGISVTTGTITNVNPKNLGDTRDVIQTDTAINSGNSGGPVFNALGEVVGVATYKIVSQDSSAATTEGLGFALSSNFATDFLKKNNVSYTAATYNA